jgi:type II secretory pathway pseudopilin PulG
MRREQGFSYVIAMFMVAVLSVFAMRAVQITLTKEKREKEEQLLDLGLTYWKAIRSYYENSPGTSKTYPTTLAALLLDDRTSTTRRHLRKLYRDPITGGEWGVIRTEGGTIKGVFSLSTRVPLKQGNFPDALAASNKAMKYSDWQFSYIPQ